jgi:hypothetical protein
LNTAVTATDLTEFDKERRRPCIMKFQLLGEIPTIHEIKRFGTQTNRDWRERERERESPSEINLLPTFLITY